MPDVSWLAACPARFHAALARGATGDLPPNVALMQMLMHAEAPGEVEAVLKHATAAADSAGVPEAAGRLADLHRLVARHPGAWLVVKDVIREAAHDVGGGADRDAVSYWRDVFDRAARRSPAASVALYSLGSPALLSAATAELATCLRGWGLLGRARRVLEIGCGTGRVLHAIAADVALAVGIDISPAMLAHAARAAEAAETANVHFLRSAGQDLAFLADRSFDLILAVDSFPYLVQPDLVLAARHIAEAARVLAPGGRLLVLNFSYRGDLERDMADLGALTARSGLKAERVGARDFRLWDGVTFLYRAS